VLVEFGPAMAAAPTPAGAAGPSGAVDRSPLQIAVSPDGKLLLTANRTANSVSIIDTVANRVVAEIPVGAAPNGVAFSPDGKTAYVANRFSDTLSVIDVASRKVAAEIRTANQPFDLFVAPNGTVYVTCVGKDEVVQAIEPRTNAVKATIAVDENPRHLALSPDQKTLVVTCDAYDTTRFVNLIDVATAKVRQRILLEMTSNLRGVAYVRPDVLLIAHLNPKPFTPLTQVQQGWVNTNAITFVYLKDKPERATLLLDEFVRYYANPYDVAVAADGKLAYLTCGGADQVLVVDIARALGLVERTPADRRPLLGGQVSLSRQFVPARIPVGANPYGLALAPDGAHVYVANHLGNSVSVIRTAERRVSATIDVGSAPQVSQLRRGEILFHSAAICFQGQFSCASCHPEGHATGLNWDLEDDGLGNTKNIKSFLGVANTGPFRWQGEALTIGPDECGPTVTGAMRGQPLSTEELAALEAFTTQLPLQPNPYRGPNGTLSEAAKRGQAIFDGKAECNKCHSGPAFSNFKRRDVGTGVGRYDNVKLRDGQTVFPPQFDVPHLLGAWDSRPYLHDGRARTLHEIFTEHNPQDKHGKTTKLSRQELDDLVEYLKTL
jgi:YVTN family beta-propeller protein